MKKGFTLVELLVVIAIIGVLAGGAVVVLGDRPAQARDARRLADMDSLKTAIDLIYTESGSYTALAIAPAAPVEINKLTGGELFKSFNQLPFDPKGTVSCATDCTKMCNYAVSEAPAAATYKIKFWLEKGAAAYSVPGCYALTEKGIVKIAN